MKAKHSFARLRKLFHSRKNKRAPQNLDDRSETEMLSNASVIAAIGVLDTTSPFSSRESPNLGEEDDKDAFNRLTDAIIANIK